MGKSGVEKRLQEKQKEISYEEKVNQLVVGFGQLHGAYNSLYQSHEALINNFRVLIRICDKKKLFTSEEFEKEVEAFVKEIEEEREKQNKKEENSKEIVEGEVSENE